MHPRRGLTFALLLALEGCASAPRPQPAPPTTAAAAPAPAPVDAPPPAPPPGYVLVRDDLGIKVYERDEPGQSLLAFRAEGLVQAPLLTVAKILLDIERITTWARRVVEATMIAHNSDREHVVYLHMSSPAPASDRDFVVLAQVDFEPPRKMTLTMVSPDGDLPPHKGHVRGRMLPARFEIEAVGEQQTRVTLTARVDPAGFVPNFLVNQVQRRWSHAMLLDLRRRAAQPDANVVPDYVQGLLVRNGFR